MNKTARNILKQARKRGQTVNFISEERTTRCPCWSEAFQQPDVVWHEANPDAQKCNDEGYLVTRPLPIEAHVFIIPYAATSRTEIPVFSHFIEKLGPVKRDDHLLITPELPDNIVNLEWAGTEWHVHNPIAVPIGDSTGVWLALVRRA